MQEQEFKGNGKSRTIIQKGPQKREFKGVWIPAEIWRHPHLTSIDKVIYASISIHENICLDTFCSIVLEELGIPKEYTRRSLKHLEDLEIISFSSFDEGVK